MFSKLYDFEEVGNEIVYKPKKHLEQMDGKYVVKLLEQVADDAGKHIESYEKQFKKSPKPKNLSYAQKAQKLIDAEIGRKNEKEEEQAPAILPKKSFKIKAKGEEEKRIISNTLNDLKGWIYDESNYFLSLVGLSTGGSLSAAAVAWGATGDSIYMIPGVVGTFSVFATIPLMEKRRRKMRRRSEAYRSLSVE